MIRVTWSGASRRHRPGAEHPEAEARLEGALTALTHARLAGVRVEEHARLATADELSTVHDAAYVTRLFAVRDVDRTIEPETPCDEGTVLAARASAGLALDLAEGLAHGETVGAALTRPPGHHAHPARASGYCFVNHVALAARRCLDLFAARIVVVDWDVHAGDGTLACLRDEPRASVVSLHEARLFPDTDDPPLVVDRATGRCLLSRGLPPGTSDDDWRRALDEMMTEVAAFRPDVVLVSAGYDAHRDDPMSSLELTDETYAWAARRVRAVGPRVGLVLEGGYDPAALGRALVCTLEALS